MSCIERLTIVILVAVLAGCAGMAPAPSSSGTPGKAKPKPAVVEPPVSTESRQLYQQALAALKAGRLVDAERGLSAVIKRDPDLAGPHANLGMLYARTNRGALAVESLQRAIRLNPDRAAYYNELGLVYRHQGKFGEARKQYDKALDADPDYGYAHLNLGILYDLYLGEPGQALRHYERFRELVPSEAPTVEKWIADLQLRQRRSGAQARGGGSG